MTTPLFSQSIPSTDPTAPTDAGLRIYLVEDNTTIRENLIATLDELVGIAPLGYADTESDGCRWLQAHAAAWDLAIVDIFLREGSGFGVLAACKGRLSRQKVVVLSNYASAGIRQRCEALGADAVFDKSTDIDELIAYCLQLRATTP